MINQPGTGRPGALRGPPAQMNQDQNTNQTETKSQALISYFIVFICELAVAVSILWSIR